MRIRSNSFENGLYVVEFSLPPEQYPLIVESLREDPNCHLLDNILRAYGMIMIFSIRPGISDSSRERYESFREKVTPYRVYDILKDRSTLVNSIYQVNLIG